jgi:hypothetical protein
MRSLDCGIVEVDVGVRSGQDRIPGDRIEFCGNFGTVVGESEQGLYVQTDAGLRQNRGVSEVTGPTRLIRRIEKGMKTLNGLMIGDIVEREGKLFILGFREDFCLESAQGEYLGAADGELNLILRHDFASGRRSVPLIGFDVRTTSRGFHGMRVLPGDLFRFVEEEVTLVGFLPGSDLAVWDGKQYFTIGLPGVLDPNFVQIVASVESRIASAA